MRRGYDTTDDDVRPDPGELSVAALVRNLHRARRDHGRVLLEGMHALKHAVRFGAHIEVVATPERGELTHLLGVLAPDVLASLDGVALHELSDEAWQSATGRDLPSPALAVADRPAVTPGDVLAAKGPVVVLEQPRHLGNLGAVIRVAAAADAGGVLVLGSADPWHPTAVRGGAGLQFALPVARTDALPDTDRPLVALDADGGAHNPVLPPDALLLVGTERAGLSPALRQRAASTYAIPMRDGVSSLNLATAVAVALYRR